MLRGVRNKMNYLINIVVILVVILAILVINMLTINNSTSEKLKILLKNTIYGTLMLALNGFILFIVLQLALNFFNINSNYLNVILIAIYGIVIVSLGDYMSRDVLRKITTKNFSKKYGGITLTKEEMQEIYIRNKRSFYCWKYILNFLISGLAYSIITEFILQDSNLFVIGLISFSSVVFYEVLFKKVIYK